MPAKTALLGRRRYGARTRRLRSRQSMRCCGQPLALVVSETRRVVRPSDFAASTATLSGSKENSWYQEWYRASLLVVLRIQRSQDRKSCGRIPFGRKRTPTRGLVHRVTLCQTEEPQPKNRPCSKNPLCFKGAKRPKRLTGLGRLRKLRLWFQPRRSLGAQNESQRGRNFDRMGAVARAIGCSTKGASLRSK